jgi:ATP-dependent helicase/nuclease subunit A
MAAMNNIILEQRKSLGKDATKQQNQASNPISSVWVEASAGTGKTKVLSDRVLRLLLNNVHPGKILCLTFTKAAAVEMSTRITGKLSSWAVLSDEKLSKEISKLIGKNLSEPELENLKNRARKLFAILLDSANGIKIQTIHSFCQETLKRFPIEAGISPYFEVMSDRDAKEILENIKAKMMEEISNNPTSEIAQSLSFITSNFSESSYGDLLSEITSKRNKISKLIDKYGSIENIIEKIKNNFELDEIKSVEEVKKTFFNNANISDLKLIMNALLEGGKENNKRGEDLALILSKNNADYWQDFEKYTTLYLNKDGELRSRIADKKTLEKYADLYDLMEFEAVKCQRAIEEIKSMKVIEATKAVYNIALYLIKEYDNYKVQKSLLDYDDLIITTQKLLSNRENSSWVLFKLDGGIDNILIDEAQDTSPEQWAIVKSISEEFFLRLEEAKNRTIFVVGDRKQSIYSFQGADPKEFINMNEYFTKKAREVKMNWETVNLKVSFRSTSAVLQYVDTVFKIEENASGVVLEGETLIHQPFRKGDAGLVELWPVLEVRKEEDEKAQKWQTPDKRSKLDSSSVRLAKLLAQKIKTLVENKEILASQNRPIKYSDFMILVQRRNAFVEDLVREFKNVKVEVAGVDRIRLSEQIVVQDMIAIAEFLLNQNDDLTLATILKSPIFGLDDDDLFKLCYDRGGRTLWQRLNEEKTTDERYQTAYNILSELLAKADYIRPFELYSYILNVNSGKEKIISRLGIEAEDALEEFLNLTIEFERTHIALLQKFVHWMKQDDVEIKRDLEQGEIDAVRIMTVHGSKGLQAPIVILPDVIRFPQTSRKGMLWDDELFYAPTSSADYNDYCNKSHDKKVISTEEEYKRLLYVALTRAEDRLYITGYKGLKGSKNKNWYDICQDAMKVIGGEKTDEFIANSDLVDDDKIYAYDCNQELEVEAENKKEKSTKIDFDDSWIYEMPNAEPTPPRPLSPSKPDEEEVAMISPIIKDDKNRFKRGNVIHKLLQILPDMDSNIHEKVIAEYLTQNMSEINELEKEIVINEILTVLTHEEFSPIFSKNSKAEVPIMGMIGNKVINGQIDRLVVLDEEVLIIDYKTNRPAARISQDLPEIYRKQLESYKKIMEQIYKDKKIKCAILWTDICQLMTIEV